MLIITTYLALVFYQFHTKMARKMNSHFIKLIKGSWDKITYLFTFNKIDTRCMEVTSHACSHLTKLIKLVWEINEVIAAIL